MDKFNTFYNKLSFALKKALPGSEAHNKMLPKGREKSIPKNTTGIKKSAVMLLCYLYENEFYFILIKRAKDGGKHSGQIALPGGGVEKFDKDILETAIRETKEEIGVTNIKIAGLLSPIYIPVSNYIMQPVIGLLNKKPIFTKCENEVDKIYSVKINDIVNTKIITKTLKINNEQIVAPFYIINDIEIWGATAMVLSEFIEILKNIK